MVSRANIANKLALLLLCLVVLELVLIGDRVAPVKSLKKKIYLKKLKKLIPLLALVKPKKKILLVPVPIPMFKPQGFRHQNHQQMMTSTGANLPRQPTSMFMMMPTSPTSSYMPEVNSYANVGPQLIGVPMEPLSMPNTTMSDSSSPTSMGVQMPSMTMIIQSQPGGMSAIELTSTASTSISPNSTMSAALIQRPFGAPLQTKGRLQHPNELQVQKEVDSGDYYYSSPWQASKSLTSPAKLLRAERTHVKQQVGQYRQPAPLKRPLVSPSSSLARLRHQFPIPFVQQPQSLRYHQHYYGSQRDPSSWTSVSGYPASEPARLVQPIQQQQIQQHPVQQEQHQGEFEEQLVQVGPARMVPVFQSPNGQLHMTPPTLPPISGSQPDQQSSKRDHERENSFEVENLSSPVSSSTSASPLSSSSVPSSASPIPPPTSQSHPQVGTSSSEDLAGEVRTVSGGSRFPEVATTSSSISTSSTSQAHLPSSRLRSRNVKSNISAGGY